MLISAAFLCFVRILAPVEMNWDEAVQLESAHRLVQGLGLTSTYFPPPFDPVEISSNLLETPDPQLVTWWPPGYSLLVAGLLSVGLPLASALKVLFGATTLLGWLGWAILGSHFLARPLKLRSAKMPVNLLLAVLLPIFYTPAWSGTDLFLWAAVPFVVLLLFRAEVGRSFKVTSLVGAGLVFGVLAPIRYSSIFLAIAAGFILLQFNFVRIFALARKYAIFLAGSLVFIIPLALYNKFAGSNKPASSLYANPDVKTTTIPGLPEFVSFTSSYDSLGDAVSSILKSSSTIAGLSGIHLSQFAAFLKTNAGINLLHGAFCLLLILAFPLLIWLRDRARAEGQAPPNLALALSSMPLALILLLVASTFAQDYDFVGTPRYYIPVFLPFFFLAYQFATLPAKQIFRAIKLAFALFIIAFLAFNVLYRPVLLLQQKRAYLAKTILGSYLSYRHDYRYPSNKTIAIYDDASAKVRELQAENPDALFFIQDYPFFVYDGYEGLRTLPTARSKFWQRAYVDKPVKIFWVVNKKCPTVCSAHRNDDSIKEFSVLPNLKEVFRAEREGSKILVTELPAGYEFGQGSDASRETQDNEETQDNGEDQS